LTPPGSAVLFDLNWKGLEMYGWKSVDLLFHCYTVIWSGGYTGNYAFIPDGGIEQQVKIHGQVGLCTEKGGQLRKYSNFSWVYDFSRPKLRVARLLVRFLLALIKNINLITLFGVTFSFNHFKATNNKRLHFMVKWILFRCWMKILLLC